MGTRKISVLLTRHKSVFSNFIYYISGRGYTHASIALDDRDDVYYSFNVRGFVRERPKRWGNKEKSICYRFKISEEEFFRIENRIQLLEENKEQMKYSRLGLLLCIFGIPYKVRNRYFCSQFVAELLTLVETIRLKKEPSLYFPNQFVKELEQQIGLYEISLNPI